MKAIVTLLIICTMGCFMACNGQTKQTIGEGQTQVKSKKKDTIKQMNLLNEQTKMFGQLFELVGAEQNPVGGATNYLELLNKMDLPKDQKAMLFEQYKIYDLSLGPGKKDSLKLMVNKMMTKAMEKSKNEQ